MKKSLIILFLIMIVSSCGILKPRPTTQIQHDTLTVYKNNTVYQKDSIYFWRDRFIYTKGDTVYSEITVYKDRWREKEIHDTLYVEKSHDSETQEPVYIEKELTWTQKTLIGIGKAAICILALILGYFVVKKFILKI